MSSFRGGQNMEKQSIVQQAFIKIMDERIFQIAWNKAKTDDLYVKTNKEKEYLIEELRNSLLTKEQKILLDELESAWGFEERIFKEYAYRQGLQDSQMIHKELNSFGIDVTKESMSICFSRKVN